jgi:glycerophosphoryl diester phosphodiesterase
MAIQMGADAIEFDVRRTMDGVLVIHHNRAVRRSQIPISRSSYSDVVEMAEKRGFHIPTLDEALECCAGRIALDIEMKEIGYEESVLEAAYVHFDLHRVAFRSFKDATVARVKELEPASIAGLIVRTPGAVVGRRAARGLSVVTRLLNCHADFVSPHWRLLRLGFLRRIDELRLPVVVWTVDNEAQVKKLIQKQLAGIITNKPDRIYKLLHIDN